MKHIVAGTARFLSPAIALALLAGCAAPVMKTSSAHVQPSEPAASGSIPSPVQLPAILPRPRATVKPETYSVVVNNVRVQELLFALARDAKLNVDIHPGISGVVTLNAIDQTLPQLLTRISKQTDMRWELDGPNLVVMPDTPFLRIYKIDYLNMDRQSNSTVSVSGNVGGVSAGGGGGGGSGNSSTTTVQNRSDNNFWKTLVENLKALLQETDKMLPAGATNPAPTAPNPATTPTAGGSSPAPAAPVTAFSGPTFREAASVISNPESGILSIRASSRQHEKVQEFLDQVLSSAKRQVLIEATIVEVTLSNDYQQGIDWSLLRRGPSGISITQAATGAVSASPTGSFFSGSVLDPSFSLGNLSASVRLLESFGNVRVLSSPKLSVMNNQSALLRVVDDLVYFKIDSTTTPATVAGGLPTTSFNTTANTVAVGFVMSVTPQIAENDTVLLNVRPSLTRLLRYVNDPNPQLVLIPNQVPELQRREMESLIKVNNGQIAVMGGLIEDNLRDQDDSIPGASRAGFGSLFGQRVRTNRKTELVVIFAPRGRQGCQRRWRLPRLPNHVARRGFHGPSESLQAHSFAVTSTHEPTPGSVEKGRAGQARDQNPTLPRARRPSRSLPGRRCRTLASHLRYLPTTCLQRQRRRVPGRLQRKALL
jgi:MSHA biogenesis protein MshL